MKFAFKRFLFIWGFAAACSAVGVAQPEMAARAQRLPFAAGEVLTYEAKISRIISGISVAELSLTVAGLPESDDFLIRADAKSKGTLLSLFRYSFSQRLESTVGADDFRVLRTVKRDVQKERVRDSKADFDYKRRRVTYTETDPKEPMLPPRRIASELSGAANDLVSAIYRLRLLPLTVGSTFTLKISDSGLVYDVPVRVTARERQKTVLGNLMCFRLEPDIFGPASLIDNKGSMILWITDDARRIPVRSRVNAPIGRIEIRLKSAKNLR